MRRSIKAIVMAVAAVCGLFVQTATAQESETQDLRNRINELEQVVNRLQTQRFQFASDSHTSVAPSCGAENAVHGDCGQHPIVGNDFLDTPCRPCGWLASAETIYLRPYTAGGLIPGGLLGGAADMNFQTSYKYTLGRSLDNGLGARISYWEFDKGQTLGAAALGVEFRTLDAELTQQVDYQYWNFQMSGGLRYGESAIDNTTLGLSSGFDGVGLTSSIQATRSLNESRNMFFQTSARWSSLYGNGHFGPIAAPGAVQFRDSIVNIVEINVGPQFKRTLSNGALLTYGGGLQSQYWFNATPNVALQTTDVGFIGFASNAQIQF